MDLSLLPLIYVYHIKCEWIKHSSQNTQIVKLNFKKIQLYVAYRKHPLDSTNRLIVEG